MSLNTLRDVILLGWHKMLCLEQFRDPAWHQDRLREEKIELEEANSYIDKLSETSDLYFVRSRARHDGCPVEDLEPVGLRTTHVYMYMIVKLTLRWGFYKANALLCGSPGWWRVCEVVNPRKDGKLVVVAERNDIDPHKFTRVGRLLRVVWLLLP